jgi:hypothetical protein
VQTPKTQLYAKILRQKGDDDETMLPDRLLAAADVANEAEGRSFFKPNDFRWAETLQGADSPTGRPKIYINDAKFGAQGSENYRDKMVLLESLHLLKDVDTPRYKKIHNAAMSDSGYVDWAKKSYQHAQDEYLHENARRKKPTKAERKGTPPEPVYQETRSFDDWHKQSRLDQVIGGFLMAGDKDIPTAKNWSRNLPFGTGLTKELIELEKDLGGQLK